MGRGGVRPPGQRALGGCGGGGTEEAPHGQRRNWGDARTEENEQGSATACPDRHAGSASSSRPGDEARDATTSAPRTTRTIYDDLSPIIHGLLTEYLTKVREETGDPDLYMHECWHDEAISEIEISYYKLHMMRALGTYEHPSTTQAMQERGPKSRTSRSRRKRKDGRRQNKPLRVRVPDQIPLHQLILNCGLKRHPAILEADFRLSDCTLYPGAPESDDSTGVFSSSDEDDLTLAADTCDKIDYDDLFDHGDDDDAAHESYLRSQFDIDSTHHIHHNTHIDDNNNDVNSAPRLLPHTQPMSHRLRVSGQPARSAVGAQRGPHHRTPPDILAADQQEVQPAGLGTIWGAPDCSSRGP